MLSLAQEKSRNLVSVKFNDPSTGEQSIFGEIHTNHALGCYKELGNRQTDTHMHMHAHNTQNDYRKISYHV